jgi:hypothetical protein
MLAAIAAVRPEPQTQIPFRSVGAAWAAQAA